MTQSKVFPISFFIAFALLIIGCFLYYAPSWGLMDDHRNLRTVTDVRNADSLLQLFAHLTWKDATDWGIFRPVYHLWVIVAYTAFDQMPVAVYVLMAVINMGALLVWGLVFYEFFGVERKYFFITVFLFPLTFFLFTPFWNIFMYISLQEKFVVLFGGLSLYFFKKAYDQPQRKYFIYNLLFTICAICSKPTAIYLPIIFTVFGFYNGFIRKDKNISFFYVWMNACLAGLYIWFTFQVQLKGRYTSPYGDNLKFWILKDKLIESPFVIKFLFLTALGMCLYGGINSFLKKKPLGFSVLLYLALLAYLSILLPWGYYSYLLCALAPMVLALFFPIYIYIQVRYARWATLNNVLLILTLLIVFTGIIVPRISEMKDIGNVVEFIRKDSLPNSTYFLPLYKEWALALNYFTGQRVIYIDREQLNKSMLDPKRSNYLLLNHLCPKTLLLGIIPDKEIFTNKTWKVISLNVKDGNVEDFTAVFGENMIQRFKSFVRGLK